MWMRNNQHNGTSCVASELQIYLFDEYEWSIRAKVKWLIKEKKIMIKWTTKQTKAYHEKCSNGVSMLMHIYLKWKFIENFLIRNANTRENHLISTHINTNDVRLRNQLKRIFYLPFPPLSAIWYFSMFLFLCDYFIQNASIGSNVWSIHRLYKQLLTVSND